MAPHFFQVPSKTPETSSRVRAPGACAACCAAVSGVRVRRESAESGEIQLMRR